MTNDSESALSRSWTRDTNRSDYSAMSSALFWFLFSTYHQS